MKVFKFYSGKYNYYCAGKDKEDAKKVLSHIDKEMKIDKVEYIPEKEWDNKFIKDLFEKDSPLQSIRDVFKEAPSVRILCTNDGRFYTCLYMQFQLLIAR